ncbi:MAG: 16S rRNA processing protein RimM [Chitinophagales bacterium]|nr:16S rRNA processing protein RimM [Chitinophagales bacterium]
MNTDELSEIGYVVRTHGVKGQLRISLNENIKELLTGGALFLLQKGRQIPFFIKELEYINASDILVLFEDINSKEEADMYARKPVWGKKELMETELKKEETGYIDFSVVDENKKEIGRVTDQIDMHEYELIEVEYNGKHILIPLHQETFIEADEKNKILCLKIPEGLLDIFSD